MVSSSSALSRSHVVVMVSGSLSPHSVCPHLKKPVCIFNVQDKQAVDRENINPPCSLGRCGVPTHTGDSHAYLAHKYSSLKSFPSGSMVYYVCEVGYSHAGGRRYRRCIKGNWSPLQLRCRRM